MRKIVIISTTFYPDPGVSAVRMTQWCRHLPTYGWKPHVLCRFYGFEASPKELAANVHPEVSVTYLDKPVPGGVAATSTRSGSFLRRQIRSPLAAGIETLAVPDVSIYAWRRLRPQILARCREIQPDVIMTTGPPHSTHDAGAWLSEETHIPWVADFRDPYLLDSRFRPRGLGVLRWSAHEACKSRIYHRAQMITHAIPLQARWGRLHFPEVRDRIRVLTNAFPRELLDDLMNTAATTSQRKTVLVTGTIPEPEQLRLAQAIKLLVDSGLDVQLKLIGKRAVCEPRLRRLLHDRLITPGYVPHRDSIRAVATADVLVNYLNDLSSRSLLMSTKLFEYLASGKPIVCINPSRSDRQLLRGRRRALILWHPSVAELATAVRRQLVEPSPLDQDELSAYRAEFHWGGRAALLAAWLREIVEPPQRKLDDSEPEATVVIATRNRKCELRRALISVFKQNVPVEVLVMDDASEDGTAEMVAREFPAARVFRSENAFGYIVQRNSAAHAATTDFIVSLDDDAEFSSVDTVKKTLAEFSDSRVGAIAIPHVDTQSGTVMYRASREDEHPWCIASFTGTAYAVRRDLFLRLGGFRDELVHQGEESDFCIRMLAAGYVVRLGGAEMILHHESPRRSFRRMDYYGSRNDLHFGWRYAPKLWVGRDLIAATINMLRTSAASFRITAHLRGAANGWMELLRGRISRTPVKTSVYQLFRALRKNGPILLADIEPCLSNAGDAVSESVTFCQPIPHAVTIGPQRKGSPAPAEHES